MWLGDPTLILAISIVLGFQFAIRRILARAFVSKADISSRQMLNCFTAESMQPSSVLEPTMRPGLYSPLVPLTAGKPPGRGSGP